MGINTFLGGGSNDYGRGIVQDGKGHIYVVGYSNASWGTPLNAHAGGDDVFVAKLGTEGDRIWNTFLGSGTNDEGHGVTADSTGNIYVTGQSDATWGAPLNAHSAGFNDDVFVAKLDSSGTLLWNTFLGSATNDEGQTLGPRR